MHGRKRALRIVVCWYLVEPRFKSKKGKKQKKAPATESKSSLGIIDEEELEHLQSDAEEDAGEKEGSIASDVDDDEDVGVESVSAEPLYVLPLYAILSSDKQARVCRLPSLAVTVNFHAHLGIRSAATWYSTVCGGNQCGGNVHHYFQREIHRRLRQSE